MKKFQLTNEDFIAHLFDVHIRVGHFDDNFYSYN